MNDIKKEFEEEWGKIGWLKETEAMNTLWFWIEQKLSEARIDENQEWLRKMDIDAFALHFPVKAITERISQLEGKK